MAKASEVNGVPPVAEGSESVSKCRALARDWSLIEAGIKWKLASSALPEEEIVSRTRSSTSKSSKADTASRMMTSGLFLKNAFLAIVIVVVAAKMIEPALREDGTDHLSVARSADKHLI